MPGSLLAQSWFSKGCVITAGLYQVTTGPNCGSSTVPFLILSGPTVLQRTLVPMPVENPFTPHPKSVGSPVKKLVIPLTCHPPSACFTKALLGFLKNGSV